MPEHKVDITGKPGKAVAEQLYLAVQNAAWDGFRTIITFDGEEIAFVGTPDDLVVSRDANNNG